MVEASAFRGVLEFFNRLGVYDVILPFILVFTVVFAILEKTKVFGTEEYEGKKYAKKNLNAMVSFSISFFVVASSKIVEIITKVSSNMVVLMFLAVFTLLLIGSFHEETEKGFFFGKEHGWLRVAFMVIIFAGMIGIFLDALGWLDLAFGYLRQFYTNVSVASVVLLIVTLGALMFVTSSNSGKKEEKKEG